MKTIVIKKKYGVGGSSTRILIKEGSSVFLLKITDLKEIGILTKYVPKLISLNDQKYTVFNKDGCSYVYKYEFIRGKHLNQVVIDDVIFAEIIKMFKYFSYKQCLAWDCHTTNIIVTNKKRVFFIDLGGIKLLSENSLYYPFIFKPGIEPDEYKSNEYPKSLNNEQFLIYYLSHRLLRECKLRISKTNMLILTKMNEQSRKKRFKSFKQIYKRIASNT